ncbi:Protein of unknown function (DUF2752) [Flavobacterium limnosediminis JC2902]|uniref:DUF2752 domain-containing protein n=1 Tax=Flavobacterium limnosediminis JC2902 TaxID=1341181 RepID=V6SJJ5_9FLAO|nr:DUF2752 domain-containing protein [Flavobacterium limnosediminis]ESU26629.1 Protein of unknown function (DUF2752) [Flavobacterium limnosediminis JC2902]
MEKYMLPCLSKKFLGIECFGCGTQRAFVLLCKGEFAEAFQMFPAIYTLLLFLGFVGLNFIDKSRNYHKAIITSAIANAIIMVVSYFIKHFYI